jgi:hypothetical protein
MDIIALALLTGFFGDLVLQLLTKSTLFRSLLGGPTGWGLVPYFKQHGSNEAMYVAAGMLGIFYVVYLYVLRLPLRYDYLALYGVALDLLFRQANLFPSLSGYYAHLNYFWSAVWGAIPMVIPYFLLRCLKKRD